MHEIMVGSSPTSRKAMRTAYFAGDTFNAGVESVPLQSPTKAASKAASSSQIKGLTPRKEPSKQAGATSTAASSGEAAPVDGVAAITRGMDEFSFIGLRSGRSEF